MRKLWYDLACNKKEATMQTTELLILLGTIAGLFIWNRSESRSDMRHMLAIIDSIDKEIKDFHGRLCAIEAARKGAKNED